MITAEQSPDEPSDGFNLRIPTGPFASRNAGPLGPILASVAGDPTPEVDRDERAMYQDIERRDAEPGYGEGALEIALDRTESSEPGGSVAAVEGRGGFPLKVTALARNRHTDLGGARGSDFDHQKRTRGAQRPRLIGWILAGLPRAPTRGRSGMKNLPTLT